MLLLVIEIFFFVVRLVGVEDDFYNFHGVVPNLLDLPLGVLQCLSPLVLLLFGQSISVLHLILLEIIIQIAQELLTIFKKLFIRLRFFDI
jgi:hypothetical protein